MYIEGFSDVLSSSVCCWRCLWECDLVHENFIHVAENDSKLCNFISVYIYIILVLVIDCNVVFEI